MIKRITLLVMIFILSLPTAVMAAEAGDGRIEGQASNGTAGGGSVAGQEVTLKTYLSDEEISVATTETDAEGRFAFDGLSTESGYAYQAELHYQQTDYTSDWIIFEDGEATQSTEVIIYEATTSDEAIRVMMAHTVVYAEQGSLFVSEYTLVVNESDRTYVGSKELAEGVNETLAFTLPENASEIQPKAGLMECCIYGSEEGFVDTMPVLPGTREISYSYRIESDSAQYTFSRRMTYPTMNYDLLIQSEDVEIVGNQLIQAEPLVIEGTRFNHFSASNIASGNVLTVRISGLPASANQGSLQWVATALLILIVGFSAVYLLRRRRLQPIRIGPALSEGSLLAEIARLDDDFGEGKITEDKYRRLRADRKAQLIKLVQGSKQERGNR